MGAVRTRRPVVLAQGVTQRRHKPDYILLLMSVLLLVVGLIVVYAISPGLSVARQVGENYFVTKQLIAIGLGVVAFTIVTLVPLGTWRTIQKPLLVGAGLATLIALVMPVSAEYPAHRWIRLGGISLQSVELVKFAMIICLASFLADRIKQGQVGDTRRTLKPLVIVLGTLGLVVAVLQKDLGSTAVVLAVMAAMTFVAGLPLTRIMQIGGVTVVALLLLILPFSYRRDRITTFMNPEADCQNAGYQACQALIAVGSGGLFGKGLAHSGQAYGYLPEAANDSIFAIIAEKFGFVGASLLVCLLMALFIRIKNIIERAPDDFSRLIATGVLAWLSTQAFINIGAMVGLLPLKGITLPFISYGGTSVVFAMAAVGLVFQISRYTTYGVNTTDNTERKGSENTTDWRGNRRPHYANPGRRP
jgi:cell division protein FtsW